MKRFKITCMALAAMLAIGTAANAQSFGNNSTFNLGVSNATDGTVVLDATNPSAPAANTGLIVPRVNKFPLFAPTSASQAELVYLNSPVTVTENGVSVLKTPCYYYWDTTTVTTNMPAGYPARWTSLCGGNVKTEYLQATSYAVQHASTNGVVLPFSGTTDAYFSPSNSITYTATTVTLQPGKTYMLKFSPLQVFYGTDGTQVGYAFCSYIWYNNTTGLGIGQFGHSGYVVGGFATPPQIQGFKDEAVVIVTPTVATSYSVKTADMTPGALGLNFLGSSISVITMP